MTLQSDRQASVRAQTGTAGTYEGDWHALFAAAGIAAGPFDGRMLAWINQALGQGFISLPQAQQAFAVSQGAANWNALGAFSLFTPFTADFVNGVYTKGGNAAAVGDLFVENLDFWGTFDPATAIVAGTGLVSDAASGGNSSPALSPGLFAGLASAGGATFVATITLASPGLQSFVLGDTAFSQTFVNPGGGTQATRWSPANTQAGYAAGAHKIALTLNAAGVSFSVDGAAVLTGAHSLGTLAFMGVDVTNAGDVMKTLAMQAAVADATLPTLSV